MTTSLTDQRERADLITELYDRHATGLFAYCADQLGDPSSAADALVAVLSSVATVQPPRASLYAYARREIHRRDVVYAPPVVDPLIDPASALVERTLRELRPHQREVLLLCEVCGLNRSELAWVLDVATDTAEELAISAGHRFKQTLATALACTGARVPKPVADVYGALGVAPLRDVLGRLPWPSPPASLRVHFAGSRTATAAPLFVRPRWPVPPQWPLPLGESDPATSTGLFPTELLTPPQPVRDPSREHEATTAPMPKVRNHTPPRRGSLRLPAPSERPGGGSPRLPDPFERTGGGSPRLPLASEPFVLSAPVPADVLDDEPITQEMPVVGDVLVAGSKPGSLFTPPVREPGKEPVYLMPEQPAPPAEGPAGPTGEAARPAGEGARPAGGAARPAGELGLAAGGLAAGGPVSSGGVAAVEEPAVLAAKPTRAANRPAKPVGRRPVRVRKERHYDWAWELIGFLICLAIALVVFFSIPTIVHP